MTDQALIDQTAEEANFRVLLNIAGELERIANRLDEPMTQPMKQLLGELRELNMNLKDICTAIYHTDR